MEFVEQVISPAEVPFDPISCPRCKRGNITIKGLVTRGFEERRQGTTVIEQKFDNTLERETKEIDCFDCSITFLVMTEKEYELHMTNFGLKEMALSGSKGFVIGSNKVH